MDQHDRMEEEFIEIDLREYFRLLWQRKWIIIGLVFIAVIGSYFISREMTRYYQTSTLVMVQDDKQMAEELFSGQSSLFGSGGNKVATYTKMLTSRRILAQVIDDLKLADLETGEPISTSALKRAISVNGEQETNLITITVTYPDPHLAQAIANQLVKVFIDENQDLNRADLQGASQFISNQLDVTKSKLLSLEEDLLNYKEQNEIVLPEEQQKSLIEKLTQLETNRTKARLQVEQAQASLGEINKHLEGEDQEIISSKVISNNPIIMNNREKLSSLQLELVGLKEVYTDKHPRVKELKTKIAEVEKTIKEGVAEIVTSRTETLNPIYQSLREKIINLQTGIVSGNVQLDICQKQIDDINKNLRKLPAKQLELTRLQREITVTENVYLMLRTRREEIKIQEAMQTSDLVTVDPAIVKENPIKPNVKLNIVIAAFLALFIGIGIIFLMEYLDRTIKEEEDIERLTGLPVLGVIPDISNIDHSSGYGAEVNEDE